MHVKIGLEKITDSAYIKTILDAVSEIMGRDFILNFIKKYSDSGKEYLLFLTYFDKSKKPSEISKVSGLKPYHVVNWINKKEIPWSIKCLIEVYNRNFHKIPKDVLARIIGWGFGDGGLDNRPHYYFICGKKQDLEKISEFIKNKTGIMCCIRENKSNSNITKIDGTTEYMSGRDTWMLMVRSTSFAVFLHSLGLPNGQKVTKPFMVPEWIMNGGDAIKKEFLSALFECELERFRMRKRNKKIVIYPVTFSMNKVVDLTDNLKEFLNQIVSLLKNFNIKITKFDKPKLSRIRADGKKTIFIRFRISGSSTNIINFSEVINFKFNEDKQTQLEYVLREAKNKNEKMLYQLRKFEKANELKTKGYSTYGIAKTLNISYPTAKDWTTKQKHIPLMAKNKTEVLL